MDPPLDRPSVTADEASRLQATKLSPSPRVIAIAGYNHQPYQSSIPIAGPASSTAATPIAKTTNASFSDLRLHSPTASTAKQKNAPKNKPRHPFDPCSEERMQDRISFSSVKERAGTLAQTFVETKISSFVGSESALEDEEELESPRERADRISSLEAVSSSIDSGVRLAGLSTTNRARSATNLNSAAEHLATTVPRNAQIGARSGSFLSPCDTFLGWKGYDFAGKVASKSYGDLNALRMGWEVQNSSRTSLVEVVELNPDRAMAYKHRLSAMESLPLELLINIIDYLHIDLPPVNFSTRNADLMSLLLTSRTLHSVTLSTLYSKVTIPHSRIFHKFLSHIREYPSLGTIVRRLDFSHFNPTGTSMTARERKETPFLVAETLLQCLELTPRLREFLVQEHADDDLDARVISKLLFGGLAHMQAVDFCACTSRAFTDSFVSLFEVEPVSLPSVVWITRLSLHECSTLPTTVFEKLLPLMRNLTHLDVCHTRINDAALLSISRRAHLTHLNLSKCSRLTAGAILHFIHGNPAARSLVYLNLAMDAKSAELFSSSDLMVLIPSLPLTLKSLNLKGSKMDRTHVRSLLPFTYSLEELGLGRHVDFQDLRYLLFDSKEPCLEPDVKCNFHTLHYVDISDLTTSDLDITALLNSGILGRTSRPLQVIELSADVAKKLDRSIEAVHRAGWCLMEAGWRSWLVRDDLIGREDEGRANRLSKASASSLSYQKRQAMDGTRERRSSETGSQIDDTTTFIKCNTSRIVPNSAYMLERDTGVREWKWGATYWGMRKVPVARCEVGGMYGHYMFKR